MPKLLIIGYGYSAAFVCRQLAPQGWQVVGTRRSPSTPSYPLLGSDDSDDSVPILAYSAGNHAIPPALQKELATVSHLLITVPPTADGCPVAQDFANLSPQSLPALRWIGYCSATNVYGDHGGAWVNEDSPCKAKPGSRGGNRLLAEQQWQQLAADKGWPAPIVFRLAGIYGPGRSMLDRVGQAVSSRDGRLRNNAPIPVSDTLPPMASKVMVSRIHVVDLARLLVASMVQQALAEPAAKPVAKPSPPCQDSLANQAIVYNLADSMPAPSAEVLAYAARLRGFAPPITPPESLNKTSAMAVESKKVDGQRILQALHAKLCYPSYREGLQAIADQDLGD